MKNVKTYNEFVNESLNESFTITAKELPLVGDIVDKIEWKEGEKIAFVNFKGVENIPVNIENESEVIEPEVVSEN